uniref:Uncharacterized protein n=1 Tax=Panagrolaimus sp. JU765 TaxID=591449 RepID=A0AC34QZ79_9BILA
MRFVLEVDCNVELRKRSKHCGIHVYKLARFFAIMELFMILCCLVSLVLGCHYRLGTLRGIIGFSCFVSDAIVVLYVVLAEDYQKPNYYAPFLITRVMYLMLVPVELYLGIRSLNPLARAVFIISKGCWSKKSYRILFLIIQGFIIYYWIVVFDARNTMKREIQSRNSPPISQV